MPDTDSHELYRLAWLYGSLHHRESSHAELEKLFPAYTWSERCLFIAGAHDGNLNDTKRLAAAMPT